MTDFQTCPPDQLAALALLLAGLDGDSERAERIYLDTGPVPLVLGLVAVATGLGQHACRTPAALRELLVTTAHEVELRAASTDRSTP